MTIGNSRKRKNRYHEDRPPCCMQHHMTMKTLAVYLHGFYFSVFLSYVVESNLRVYRRGGSFISHSRML